MLLVEVRVRLSLVLMLLVLREVNCGGTLGRVEVALTLLL